MEVDKIASQKLGARVWGVWGRCKGRLVERGEKGRIGESLGEWDGAEGGRMDMGAGKYIS